jgi:DNA mismatch endonuclease (patch repair protein)
MHWPNTSARLFDPMSERDAHVRGKGTHGVDRRAVGTASPSKRPVNDMARPRASSRAVRERMRSTPQRDTPAELRVRRLLHAMGLRYLIDARPLQDSSRRADIVFRRAMVAVFIDGCFWHGCPKHGTWPKTNEHFWREKILANRARDSDTSVRLRQRGWLVVRVWEHEDPTRAAERVARRVRAREPMPEVPRSAIQ